MPNSSRVKAILAKTVQACSSHGKTHWPPEKRKARWEQKIMDEIARRYTVDVAAALIGAYVNKRAWAIRRFNEIDAQIKARKARI
jgi:cytochrome P450